MSRTGHTALPLARRHMPAGHEISLPGYTRDFSVRVPGPEARGPAQTLPGFEPQYRNIVDYIVRITHRIWESADHAGAPRDVDYIGACYAPDSRVFDDYGLQTGSTKIIADTRHTTGAFPDIALDATEIIWAGDAETGFRSSHRVRITGTNTGPSRYGPPTGRRTDFFCIANCVSKQNDIFLEHVNYNTAAMLADLGLDPAAEAARLAADPPAGWPRGANTWAALRRAGGPPRPISEAEPVVAGFDPDAFARAAARAFWTGEGGDLSASHAEILRASGPAHLALDGRAALEDWAARMRRALPDPDFSVDEVYWMGNPAEDLRIATRWSMEATHSGDSPALGPATGARLQLWGLTQQTVRDGRVVEEWLLYNELDAMMQAAAARL